MPALSCLAGCFKGYVANETAAVSAKNDWHAGQASTQSKLLSEEQVAAAPSWQRVAENEHARTVLLDMLSADGGQLLWTSRPEPLTPLYDPAGAAAGDAAGVAAALEALLHGQHAAAEVLEAVLMQGMWCGSVRLQVPAQAGAGTGGRGEPEGADPGPMTDMQDPALEEACADGLMVAVELPGAEVEPDSLQGQLHAKSSAGFESNAGSMARQYHLADGHMATMSSSQQALGSSAADTSDGLPSSSGHAGLGAEAGGNGSQSQLGGSSATGAIAGTSGAGQGMRSAMGSRSTHSAALHPHGPPPEGSINLMSRMSQRPKTNAMLHVIGLDKLLASSSSNLLHSTYNGHSLFNNVHASGQVASPAAGPASGAAAAAPGPHSSLAPHSSLRSFTLRRTNTCGHSGLKSVGVSAAEVDEPAPRPVSAATAAAAASASTSAGGPLFGRSRVHAASLSNLPDQLPDEASPPNVRLLRRAATSALSDPAAKPVSALPAWAAAASGSARDQGSGSGSLFGHASGGGPAGSSTDVTASADVSGPAARLESHAEEEDEQLGHCRSSLLRTQSVGSSDGGKSCAGIDGDADEVEPVPLQQRMLNRLELLQQQLTGPSQSKPAKAERTSPGVLVGLPAAAGTTHSGLMEVSLNGGAAGEGVAGGAAGAVVPPPLPPAADPKARRNSSHMGAQAAALMAHTAQEAVKLKASLAAAAKGEGGARASGEMSAGAHAHGRSSACGVLLAPSPAAGGLEGSLRAHSSQDMGAAAQGTHRQASTVLVKRNLQQREEVAMAGGADVVLEIGVRPVTRPVTGERALLVTTRDVSARAHVEDLLVELTEQQLGVVSQMFPEHIISFLAGMRGGQPASPAAAQGMSELARRHQDATILFMDIVGFTSMSKEVEPWQVMQLLNEFFSILDALVEVHGVHKVETAGDCYIVSAGVVETGADGFMRVVEEHSAVESARKVMRFAQGMLAAANHVRMPHNGEPLSIRIGIHTGALTSGIVGYRLPKFQLVGDTMNTASRMESTCVPKRIQISASTHALLRDFELWEPTGGIDVKGKGRMETYLWVAPESWPATLPPPYLVQQGNTAATGAGAAQAGAGPNSSGSSGLAGAARVAPMGQAQVDARRAAASGRSTGEFDTFLETLSEDMRVAEEEFFSSIRVGETLGSSLLATGTQLEPQQQLTQQRAGRVQPGRAGAAPGSRRFGTGGGVNSGLLTSTQIFTDSTLMGTACLLPTVDFSLAALLQAANWSVAATIPAAAAAAAAKAGGLPHTSLGSSNYGQLLRSAASPPTSGSEQVVQLLQQQQQQQQDGAASASSVITSPVGPLSAGSGSITPRPSGLAAAAAAAGIRATPGTGTGAVAGPGPGPGPGPDRARSASQITLSALLGGGSLAGIKKALLGSGSVAGAKKPMLSGGGGTGGTGGSVAGARAQAQAPAAGGMGRALPVHHEMEGEGGSTGTGGETVSGPTLEAAAKSEEQQAVRDVNELQMLLLSQEDLGWAQARGAGQGTAAARSGGGASAFPAAATARPAAASQATALSPTSSHGHGVVSPTFQRPSEPPPVQPCTSIPASLLSSYQSLMAARSSLSASAVQGAGVSPAAPAGGVLGTPGPAVRGSRIASLRMQGAARMSLDIGAGRRIREGTSPLQRNATSGISGAAVSAAQLPLQLPPEL